jgi:hypothetical protein
VRGFHTFRGLNLAESPVFPADPLLASPMLVVSYTFPEAAEDKAYR